MHEAIFIVVYKKMYLGLVKTLSPARTLKLVDPPTSRLHHRFGHRLSPFPSLLVVAVVWRAFFFFYLVVSFFIFLFIVGLLLSDWFYFFLSSHRFVWRQKLSRGMRQPLLSLKSSLRNNRL